jgi:hypothetical protein
VSPDIRGKLKKCGYRRTGEEVMTEEDAEESDSAQNSHRHGFKHLAGLELYPLLKKRFTLYYMQQVREDT